MFADTLSSCPSDHPFPFGEGVHCCRYHARSSACQSGPAGTDLEMNDSPECCIEDDSVLCVNDGGSETVCNTHENAECELKLLGLLEPLVFICTSIEVSTLNLKASRISIHNCQNHF